MEHLLLMSESLWLEHKVARHLLRLLPAPFEVTRSRVRTRDTPHRKGVLRISLLKLGGK